MLRCNFIWNEVQQDCVEEFIKNYKQLFHMNRDSNNYDIIIRLIRYRSYYNNVNSSNPYIRVKFLHRFNSISTEQYSNIDSTNTKPFPPVKPPRLVICQCFETRSEYHYNCLINLSKIFIIPSRRKHTAVSFI